MEKKITLFYISFFLFLSKLNSNMNDMKKNKQTNKVRITTTIRNKNKITVFIYSHGINLISQFIQ